MTIAREASLLDPPPLPGQVSGGGAVEDRCGYRVSDQGPGIAPEVREGFEVPEPLRPPDEVEGRGSGFALPRVLAT